MLKAFTYCAASDLLCNNKQPPAKKKKKNPWSPKHSKVLAVSLELILLTGKHENENRLFGLKSALITAFYQIQTVNSGFKKKKKKHRLCD